MNILGSWLETFWTTVYNIGGVIYLSGFEPSQLNSGIRSLNLTWRIIFNLNQAVLIQLKINMISLLVSYLLIQTITAQGLVFLNIKLYLKLINLIS